MANDWLYPETWQVGDTLDANTLNRRVRDQNTVLLRRPMFIAHSASAQTIATATDTVISFDTIDVDDDGMAMAGAPVTNITVQREGAYQFWLNTSNGMTAATPTNLQTSIWISNATGSRRWDLQARGWGVASWSYCHSQSGLLFLNVGEYFTCHTYQDSGGNTTMAAENNTPRIVVMWLGIT